MGVTREEGNVIKFLMQFLNVSFPVAISELSQRLGREIPQQEEDEKSKRYKEQLQLMALAKDYFKRVLSHDTWGAQGRYYAKERQLSVEVIEKFDIGFAPPHEKSLATAALKKGYSKELLAEVGLIYQRKNANFRIKDYFRHRFMFPICDESGKTIAFGGRVVDSKNQPKYLNSSETALFKKNKILYGLHIAKKDILKEQTALIVEGYMNCCEGSMVKD